MEKIIPRWEWRTFGQDFGEAEAALRGASRRESSEQRRDSTWWPPAQTRTSRSATSFSTSSFANSVDANGLEQWRPVLKEPFPLSATAVARVSRALGLPAPRRDRDSLSLDQLLESARAPWGPVRDRQRQQNAHAISRGRLCFRAHRRVANGKKVRTVANRGCRRGQGHRGRACDGARALSQHELPARLETAHRTLGDTRTPFRRQAVIDVGTNSVKFHDRRAQTRRKLDDSR